MSPILKPAIIALSSVWACSVAVFGFALPTDSQQELNLSSDSANVDLKRGVVIHKGNVKLTQGSLRIESDELIVHRRGDVIEQVIATGSPAVFEQQPEEDQAPIIARGQRIEYHLQDAVETISVIDNARIEQGGIVSRCDRIEFNLTESTAKMMGSCATGRPAQPPANRGS